MLDKPIIYAFVLVSLDELGELGGLMGFVGCSVKMP
jgi:hypothetical protein